MSIHKHKTKSILEFVFDNFLAIFLSVLAFNLIFGGFATEYVVETWGAVATGHVVDVSFVLCAVAGLFLGEILIPAAVFTLLLVSAGVI